MTEMQRCVKPSEADNFVIAFEKTYYLHAPDGLMAPGAPFIPAGRIRQGLGIAAQLMPPSPPTQYYGVSRRKQD